MKKWLNFLVLFSLLISSCNTVEQILISKKLPEDCAEKARFFTSKVKRTNREGIIKISYNTTDSTEIAIIDQKLQDFTCFFKYLTRNNLQSIFGKPVMSYQMSSNNKLAWGYFVLNDKCRRIRKTTKTDACGLLMIYFKPDDKVLSLEFYPRNMLPEHY